jgi:hypothetical protein
MAAGPESQSIEFLEPLELASHIATELCAAFPSLNAHESKTAPSHGLIHVDE